MPPGNSNAKPESTSAYRGRTVEGRPTNQSRSTVPTIQSGPHRTNVPSRALFPTYRIEQYDEKHSTVQRTADSGNIFRGLHPSEASTTTSNNTAHVESVVQAGVASTSKTAIAQISSPSTIKATDVPPNSIASEQGSGQARVASISKTAIAQISSPSTIKAPDVPPNSVAPEQGGRNAHQYRNELTSEPRSVSNTDLKTIGVTTPNTNAASCDNYTSENRSCQSGAIPKRSALKNDGNDNVMLSESISSISNFRETTAAKPLDSSSHSRESALKTVPFELQKIQRPDSKCVQSLKDAEGDGNNASDKTANKTLRNCDRNINAREIKDFSDGRASVEKSTWKNFGKNSDSVFIDSVVSDLPTKKQHSRSAVIYEGVVEQIIDYRTARIKVAQKNGKPILKSQWGSADAVHMFAQLYLTKLRPSKHELFYPAGTSMKSVLEKGEVIKLICTPHNTPKIGFDLFAHEAWKMVKDKQQNNHMESIVDTSTFPVRDSMDAESVASTCSGSETRHSSSSRSRSRRRANKKDNEERFAGSIWEWLDVNANSDSAKCNSDWSGPNGVTLLEGGLYVGMVSDLRLPFAFVVQISTHTGNQWVFVFSTRFHPQGPNSPGVERGVSLQLAVNIGDEIALIPTRNEAKEKGKFGWVAKSAWPANSMTAKSDAGELDNNPRQSIGNNCENGRLQHLVHPLRLGCMLASKKWKEISGVIIHLDFDWGLVKEQTGGRSAYVFLRKNTFLFGLCLEDMILYEVFQEGQLVKFYLDTEDDEMNVCELHFENSPPNMYSFENAAVHYCRERGLNTSVETSLVHYGKKMYLQK